MKAVKSILPSWKNRAAQKAELAMLDALPVDSVKLRWVASHLNAKDLKRFGLLAAGAAITLSAVNTAGRYRFYRAAMARELKKQLAPVNKKLDALQEQNEALQKQNNELKKQLKQK